MGPDQRVFYTLGSFFFLLVGFYFIHLSTNGQYLLKQHQYHEIIKNWTVNARPQFNNSEFALGRNGPEVTFTPRSKKQPTIRLDTLPIVYETSRFYNNSYEPLEYHTELQSNWTYRTGPEISNWTSNTETMNVSFEIETVHYVSGYGASQVITTSNLIAGPFPIITSKRIRITRPSAKVYCTKQQGGIYDHELNSCLVFSMISEFCVQLRLNQERQWDFSPQHNDSIEAYESSGCYRHDGATWSPASYKHVNVPESGKFVMDSLNITILSSHDPRFYFHEDPAKENLISPSAAKGLSILFLVAALCCLMSPINHYQSRRKSYQWLSEAKSEDREEEESKAFVA